MHKAVYILTVATYIYTHMRVWHDCMQWDTCVRAFEVVLLSDFFPSSADEPFSAQYLIVKLLVALLRASPHSFWKKISSRRSSTSWRQRAATDGLEYRAIGEKSVLGSEVIFLYNAL